MLYAVPKLAPIDLQVLQEIDALRSELRHHLRDQHDWTGVLRRNLTARAISGSNTIEGYTASVEDVEDVLLGERPIGTSRTVWEEIDGYRRAMTYIQRLATAGPDFSYSKELLNALHFMMQSHHPGKRPGWWRAGAVYVTSPDDPRTIAYTGPDSGEVPGLTGELIDWLNDGDLDKPALVRAAMAHLSLVMIHPWSDGNGRMSRSLQTLMIAREQILAPEFSSIEEWLGRERNTYRYYDVLAEVGGATWSPEHDALPWLRFCLRAHHDQAHAVKHRVTTSGEVWEALEAQLDANDWPERLIYAIFPIAFGRRLRRATYQIDAGISEQQAQRDLRIVHHAGWVKAAGEAKARFYVAGNELPDSISKPARKRRRYADPYRT